jgi:glutamyl-tRNA reductase
MAPSLIGIDFNSAAPEVRERFHLSAKRIADLYQLIQVPMVILSTCNRTEIYASSPLQEADLFMQDLLSRIFPGETIPIDDFYLVHGEDAIRHLLELATGLQSMLLGETEIKGQIEKAFQTALQLSDDLGELAKVFRLAQSFANAVRTRSKLGEHSTSLTSLVVKAVEALDQPMAGLQVAVLGQGEIASKVARALSYHGCSLRIVTRRFAARDLRDADYLGWDRLEEALADSAIVIAATSAPHTLVHNEHARLLQGKLLIDLSFPRNIETSLIETAGCTLWDLEYFKSLSEANLERKRSAAKVAEAMCCDGAMRIWEKINRGHGGNSFIKVG